MIKTLKDKLLDRIEMSAKDNQKTSPAKTNSVDSILDAEVPKPTAAEEKKPMSDKMKEEA